MKLLKEAKKADVFLTHARRGSLVLQLGRVMHIPRGDEDTIESYAEKVRKKMKVAREAGAPGPGRRTLYR